jgi:hypothetical protein
MTSLNTHYTGARVILDPWQAQVERELAAEVICFHGREGRTPTQEAISCYSAARQHRSGAHGCSVEHYGSPVSEQHRNRAQATYAALAQCMVGVHPADVPEVRYGTLAACVGLWMQARCTEHVIDIVCKYMAASAERGQQYLADLLETNPRTLSRHIGNVETVMRRRFQARGLVP